MLVCRYACSPRAENHIICLSSEAWLDAGPSIWLPMCLWEISTKRLYPQSSAVTAHHNGERDDCEYVLLGSF